MCTRVDSNTAAWVAIGFAAVVRWLVIRYNWRTFAVNEWQVETSLQATPKTIAVSSRRVWRRRTAESETLQDGAGS